MTGNQAKAKAGQHAFSWWIVWGVGWHLFRAHSPGLFSLPAFGFVVLGAVVAAVVIGGVDYWLYLRWLESAVNDPKRPEAMRWLGAGFGWKHLAPAVLSYLLFSLCYLK